MQLSNHFRTASNKCSIAIFPGRQAIKMFNSNISITPNMINAIGMQLSNHSRTARNKNAQSQYFPDGKQYKYSIAISPECRVILMFLECNLANISGRQAIEMLNRNMYRTATNKNAQ